MVSGSELEQIFLELKSALHEHTERLRTTAALKLVHRENDAPPKDAPPKTKFKTAHCQNSSAGEISLSLIDHDHPATIPARGIQ